MRSPWYIRYGADGLKSAPLPRRGACILSSPAGYLSLWYTQNRKGSSVVIGKLRGSLRRTTLLAVDMIVVAVAAGAEEEEEEKARETSDVCDRIAKILKNGRLIKGNVEDLLDMQFRIVLCRGSR